MKINEIELKEGKVFKAGNRIFVVRDGNLKDIYLDVNITDVYKINQLIELDFEEYNKATTSEVLRKMQAKCTELSQDLIIEDENLNEFTVQSIDITEFQGVMKIKLKTIKTKEPEEPEKPDEIKEEIKEEKGEEEETEKEVIE